MVKGEGAFGSIFKKDPRRVSDKTSLMTKKIDKVSIFRLEQVRNDYNQLLDKLSTTDAVQQSTEQELQTVLTSLRLKNEGVERQLNNMTIQYQQAVGDLQYTQTQLANTKSQLESLRGDNEQVKTQHNEELHKVQNELGVYQEQYAQQRTRISKLQQLVMSLKKEMAAKEKSAADVSPQNGYKSTLLIFGYAVDQTISG